MIKLDEITEIEMKDGILTINQFDNNQVILTQDNLKKILEAINYTHCSTQFFCCKEAIEQRCTEQCLGCYIYKRD